MKKSKTLQFLIFALTTALLFTACPDPNGANPGDDPKPQQENDVPLTPTLEYDKSVYTITMNDVIKSSKDFVNKSIKAEVSRAAELSDDDKWQGYIDYMWNVPSNIYGTNENPGDNKLVINNEELGTLQPLVHSTDENGNYRKALFEYKGHLYYVLDKGNEDPNNSYVVLSSEDDFNHIVFDQAGKIGSDDWSNFKIWVWEKDLNGELYRRGNLGYSYTLRNVEMLDGSYATITVAGFNYYYYGFRVWIQETDGKTEKPALPEITNDNTINNSSNIEELKTVENEDDYDFIYEVVNNTSGYLIVSNYIRDYSVEDFESSIKAKTKDIQIPQGETHLFKYNTSKLAKYDNDAHSVVVGSFFTPERRWRCYGWENNLHFKNRIHTVTVTDSIDLCMDGKNSYSFCNLKELKENTENFNACYEIINKTSADYKIAIGLSHWDNEARIHNYLAATDEIEIASGATVQFKYNIDELFNQFDYNSPNDITIGFFYDGGFWSTTSLGYINKRVFSVTLFDSEQYDFECRPSFKHLNTPDGLQFNALATKDGINLILNNIPEDTNYISISDSGNRRSIYSVMNYNTAFSLPGKIEVLDEYVQEGKEYTYGIQIRTNSSNGDEDSSLEPVIASGGKGEITFSIETKPEGVIITPDNSILDLDEAQLRIRRDFIEYSNYGYQYIQYNYNDNNEENYITDYFTDYFVTPGVEYQYKIMTHLSKKLIIDEDNFVWEDFYPRSEIKTITIPENCGYGELELTTFPKATWNNETQKFVFTQYAAISANYPNNADLRYVDFIYHKDNPWSNFYIDCLSFNSQNEVSPNWWGGPGTYYSSNQNEQGDRGYVIRLRVGNIDYEIYGYQDNMFNDMPQEVTYSGNNN